MKLEGHGVVPSEEDVQRQVTHEIKICDAGPFFFGNALIFIRVLFSRILTNVFLCPF